MKRKKTKKGFALIYTLLLSATFLILIGVSTKIAIESIKNSSDQILARSQVYNVAVAGIEDAYLWFSRQKNIVNGTSLPFADKAFAPTQGTSIEFKGDTDDASIGIVRDILIDNDKKLYGHYVVKKQRDLDLDGIISDSEYDPDAVHDISHLKSNVVEGAGMVWKVTSEGYVYYRRKPEDRARDSSGNFIKKLGTDIRHVSKKVVSAEVLRLGLNVPQAAISIANGDVRTNSRSLISGGNGAGVISSSLGSISSISSTVLSGNPSSTLDIGLANKLLPNYIFSMSSNSLKGISDISVSDVSQLDPKAKYLAALIYIDGDATFTPNSPLKGSGILYVNGDLTFANESGSFFSGVIYVNNGNLRVHGGNSLSGSIVVNGNKYVNLQASADIATIEYNENIVNTVKKKLANYRLNKLSFETIN